MTLDTARLDPLLRRASSNGPLETCTEPHIMICTIDSIPWSVKTALSLSIRDTDQLFMLTLTSKRPSLSSLGMYSQERKSMRRNTRWPPLDSMPNGSQLLMKLWMLLREDTALRPSHKLTHIITPNTHQMKLHSVPAMLIQKHNPNPSSKIETHQKSLPRRELSKSTSTFRIKQTSTVQDNLLLTIALVMWWTPLCGIAPAGQLSRTPIPIKIELNTENNSTSQNHSTIELWDRVLEKSVTRTWHMSQETWELPDSEERILITRNSRRLEEELKMDSLSTLTTSRNEWNEQE